MRHLFRLSDVAAIPPEVTPASIKYVAACRVPLAASLGIKTYTAFPTKLRYPPRSLQCRFRSRPPAVCRWRFSLPVTIAAVKVACADREPTFKALLVETLYTPAGRHVTLPHSSCSTAAAAAFVGSFMQPPHVQLNKASLHSSCCVPASTLAEIWLRHRVSWVHPATFNEGGVLCRSDR